MVTRRTVTPPAPAETCRQYSPPLPGPGAVDFLAGIAASPFSSAAASAAEGSSEIGADDAAVAACGLASASPISGTCFPAQWSPFSTARPGCQISLISRPFGGSFDIAVAAAGGAAPCTGGIGGIGGDATSIA